MKLSVIIPGYNNPESWWRRCVESVIATGANEIICVDDGSKTKPTYDNLNIQPRPNIQWIYREINGGLSAARNSALEVATGDYVTFVDSDDEVSKDVYDEALKALAETNCDVAVFGVRTVWPEDGLQKIDSSEEMRSLGPLTAGHVRELDRRCLLNYAWNKVYRREFLERNHLRFHPRGMPCEDIVFNLECAMAGATFCTVPYVGITYYRTRGTLLSRYKKTSTMGLELAADTWARFKACNHVDAEELSGVDEIDSTTVVQSEWKNIWMPGTPCSLVDRWRWLKAHPELGGVSAFVKMMAFVFVRRYFYVRPIRRRNTKRQYPHAVEWEGGVS